jgi:hypothetical protein
MKERKPSAITKLNKTLVPQGLKLVLNRGPLSRHDCGLVYLVRIETGEILDRDINLYEFGSYLREGTLPPLRTGDLSKLLDDDGGPVLPPPKPMPPRET